MAGPATKVNIPESARGGKSDAELQRMFEKWMEQRTSGKTRDEGIRKATKELIARHKEEYEILRKEYTPKA